MPTAVEKLQEKLEEGNLTAVLETLKGRGLFRTFQHAHQEVAPKDIPVDGSKPAICGHRKTGHFGRPETAVEFYFMTSCVRKVVWTLVRQLRGPHLSTCA